jgi:hypothetical protein
MAIVGVVGPEDKRGFKARSEIAVRIRWDKALFHVTTLHHVGGMKCGVENSKHLGHAWQASHINGDQ